MVRKLGTPGSTRLPVRGKFQTAICPAVRELNHPAGKAAFTFFSFYYEIRLKPLEAQDIACYSLNRINERYIRSRFLDQKRIMRCPHCGNFDDKVIESRTLANGEAIRRRRECNGCGFRFTSYERIEDKQFMVIKKNGRREPFDRIKIERGVQRALEKRPVSQMNIESLVNGIEDAAALQGNNHEIAAAAIGDLVLEKLRTLDKVAYIRFASVYRHFENMDEFIREIRKMGGND
jgi:transcriptional repressor NrdR